MTISPNDSVLEGFETLERAVRRGIPPQRKDSYTIQRHGVSVRPSDVSTSDTMKLSPRNPYTLVTPTGASLPKSNGTGPVPKSYSTGTYSKRSSPFALPMSKPHAAIPFARNGNTIDTELDANVNMSGQDSTTINNRTITRPSRIRAQNKTTEVGLNVAEELLNQPVQAETPVKSNNLSMEEIQSMARMQQECEENKLSITLFIQRISLKVKLFVL